jgi:hypothetical protein
MRDADRMSPLGYAVCAGCGVAVQRRVLASGHQCDPERYAGYQTSRLYWTRHGFDDAVHAWLATPAGRFAQHYARRPRRPGEA